jgi:hypothetical protein
VIEEDDGVDEPTHEARDEVLPWVKGTIIGSLVGSCILILILIFFFR